MYKTAVFSEIKLRRPWSASLEIEQWREVHHHGAAACLATASVGYHIDNDGGGCFDARRTVSMCFELRSQTD